MPEGPQGQPGHPAGASVVWVGAVQIPDLGGVAFSVPRLSTLMLEASQQHARTGERLRTQALKQTRALQWTHPGTERLFTNEQLVCDVFREAAAAVVCGFAALDNFANEILPLDFVYVDPDSGRARTREELENKTGIELRLSRVAAAATNRPNLRIVNPALWDRLMSLKSLRDDISHAKAMQATAFDNSIFERVFLAPLTEIVEDVSEAVEHYFGDVAPET